MPWPTHGHEVTRGFFRALTRPRQAVRVELRPTYFPPLYRMRSPEPDWLAFCPERYARAACARCLSTFHHIQDCPQ